MPPRSWRLRVEDILTAIVRIQKYTQDQSFDSFQGDQMMVDAVVRNLEILGEAASHVPRDVQMRYPDVPWLDMRDMRNVAAHGYFKVDLVVVWDTIQNDLPTLLPQLREILEKEPR